MHPLPQFSQLLPTAIPLNHLALEASRACIPGPMKLKELVSPRKELRLLSGAPIFATAARGHLKSSSFGGHWV